jgi:hypothetical protein
MRFSILLLLSRFDNGNAEIEIRSRALREPWILLSEGMSIENRELGSIERFIYSLQLAYRSNLSLLQLAV